MPAIPSEGGGRQTKPFGARPRTLDSFEYFPTLMFAHVHRHESDWIVLPWLERLSVTLMRLRVRRNWHIAHGLHWLHWLLGWHRISGRAVTMAGTERVIGAGFGRPIAVVVEIDVAEVAVGFREVTSGLIPSTRSALLSVSVTVRTNGDRSIVVEVESVIAAHP